MSTLGKVLLFLNLLVAAGLVYVSAQNWSKRQEISGIVLRYHLTIQGLPFEADSANGGTAKVEISTPAGITIERVSDKLLASQFSGVTGGDVYGDPQTPKAVLDEVNRAERRLVGLIDEQQGDAGKIRYLVGGPNAQGIFTPGVLLNMAESFEERVAIRRLGYPAPATPEAAKRNADEARSRIMAKVAALKEAPSAQKMNEYSSAIEQLKAAIEQNPNDQSARQQLASLSEAGEPPFTRDEADRRRRAALFLMLLDPAADWQKRVMMVTGLKTYAEALNEQIARLTNIARATERAIENDQARFETEYELLKKLALRQDMLVSSQQALVKGLAETQSQDEANKAARQTQLNELNNQLAGLQQQIAAILERQAAAEQALFQLQRKVGDALQDNLNLERKLAQPEQPKP